MDIIFWLDTVPVCCKGVFDAVAAQWSGNTFYVCAGQLDNSRKKIACDASAGGNDGNAKYIYLKDIADSKTFVAQFIDDHCRDIHIFNGYRGQMLDRVLKKYPSAKTVVWAERPCPPKLKGRLPFSLFHSYFAMKYRNRVSALLPLGERGVKSYRRYGWPADKLFPFLYLPHMNENLPEKNTVFANGRPIRFVYLGRFTKGSKGTDVLMQAVDRLKENNYSLEMVGGYGDLLGETTAWIEQHDQVHFGGSWPIDEACERLHEFDVCIVPSKYEGWNVTLNEALMAGIGCIATDECVSDEMITHSDAGFVVPADNPEKLADAIDKVIRSPELLHTWEANAYLYRNKMTAAACSNYFVHILDFLFLQSPIERPTPPWLT